MSPEKEITEKELPERFYDAIIVAAGGQTECGPPPHVALRLERACERYRAQAARVAAGSGGAPPWIICTAWGTPHKPCPKDGGGFERHECADNARFFVCHRII